MKKILFILFLGVFSAVVYAQNCADGSCADRLPAQFKMPDTKAVAKTAKDKAKNKTDKKLEELSAKYATASLRDKSKIEKEINAVLKDREDKKIAFAKENLARQQARVKAMEENVKNLERGKEKTIKENLAKVKEGKVREVTDEAASAFPLAAQAAHIAPAAQESAAAPLAEAAPLAGAAPLAVAAPAAQNASDKKSSQK